MSDARIVVLIAAGQSQTLAEQLWLRQTPASVKTCWSSMASISAVNAAVSGGWFSATRVSQDAANGDDAQPLPGF